MLLFKLSTPKLPCLSRICILQQCEDGAMLDLWRCLQDCVLCGAECSPSVLGVRLITGVLGHSHPLSGVLLWQQGQEVTQAAIDLA